jgi:hypothetical protein
VNVPDLYARLYVITEGCEMPIHRILTDEEIRGLIQEAKTLPENWKTRLRLLPKSGSKHLQRELRVQGMNGNAFRVVLRQSTMNALDFSLILVFQDKDSVEFRLCRYNGRHPSNHTNKWEKARGSVDAVFRSRFHIHMATERYQQEGYEMDGYAEVTDRYSSYDSALGEFLRANGFQLPEEILPLFDSKGDS